MPHTKKHIRSAKLAVSRSTAADMLDISPTTFDTWVGRGWMPKGYKIGGLRRWVVEDLQSSLYDLTETNSIIDNEDTKNPFDYTVG
ncbi:DNA-binding protein [Roseibium aggregatum]|nr:DNA-binding protein [Roseibium aggregatum]